MGNTEAFQISVTLDCKDLGLPPGSGSNNPPEDPPIYFVGIDEFVIYAYGYQIGVGDWNYFAVYNNLISTNHDLKCPGSNVLVSQN